MLPYTYKLLIAYHLIYRLINRLSDYLQIYRRRLPFTPLVL